MPRAKEHVDALMLQFEGLKASIADLEEQIKRVSNLSFNKQINRRVLINSSLLFL